MAYFQAFATLPSGRKVAAADVAIYSSDDVAQLVLYNARYPKGLKPPHGLRHVGGPIPDVINLKPYIAHGTNRVVLVHGTSTGVAVLRSSPGYGLGLIILRVGVRTCICCHIFCYAMPAQAGLC